MSASAAMSARTGSALRARIVASNEASHAFFTSQADAIARACQAMALRFQSGGRLLVYGEDGRESDVSHAVVEFMHPVVVGKRALPAVRVSSFSELAVLGRHGDILLLLANAALGNGERRALPDAEAAGVLVIALVGGYSGEGKAAPTHQELAVPSDDPFVVQEVHEMLYHVLWELVHVFLDQGQLA